MSEIKQRRGLVQDLILFGNVIAFLSAGIWAIAILFLIGMHVNKGTTELWYIAAYTYPIWGVGASVLGSRSLQEKHPILAVIVANLITPFMLMWYYF